MENQNTQFPISISCPVCSTTHTVKNVLNIMPVLCKEISNNKGGCNEPVPLDIIRIIYSKSAQS